MTVAAGDNESGLAGERLIQDLAARRCLDLKGRDSLGHDLMAGEIPDHVGVLGLHRFRMVSRADGVQDDAPRPLQQGDGRSEG